MRSLKVQVNGSLPKKDVYGTSYELPLEFQLSISCFVMLSTVLKNKHFWLELRLTCLELQDYSWKEIAATAHSSAGKWLSLRWNSA